MASNVKDEKNKISERNEDAVLDANSKDFVSENYVIVDIGANLTNKKFSRDLDSVVSRAQDAGTYFRLSPFDFASTFVDLLAIFFFFLNTSFSLTFAFFSHLK